MTPAAPDGNRSPSAPSGKPRPLCVRPERRGQARRGGGQAAGGEGAALAHGDLDPRPAPSGDPQRAECLKQARQQAAEHARETARRA